MPEDQARQAARATGPHGHAGNHAHSGRQGDGHGAHCGHGHDHAPVKAGETTAGACCGAGHACGDIAPVGDVEGAGRSFRVVGLDCAEEVAILSRALGPELGGRDHLAFDVINGRMIVLDSARPLGDDRIMALVARTGMRASRWNSDGAAADRAAHMKRLRLFTAASGALWTAGLAWHVGETGIAGALRLFAGHGTSTPPTGEALLFLMAILAGVWQIAPKAWSALRRLSPDMNLLMVVAVAGALWLGEYFEAATVAFLFTLSLYLESWSVGRARNAVAALLDLAPPSARVIGDDGRETEMPAARVAIGQRFVVRGGDRIALDGTVVTGAGDVNQAPITGESAPVAKGPGDTVYAGTINGEGALTVRATRPASDTVLARIIRLVGDAHARRADIEQWVTKFARIYTPVIMALALAIAVAPPLILGGSWSYWIYNALVLLVIACPCALVISTPVSIVSALASSARNGVLIKGGAHVEAPGRITALALDKTGTITEGRPEVAAIHALGATSEGELLRAAAALEARASHPLARAILDRAATAGITPLPADDSRTLPGRGVEGRLDGRLLWLGSGRLAAERGAALPETLRDRIEGAGGTLVAVGADDRLLGVLDLRDRIRPEAREIVSALHAQGIGTIVMLTGDNEAAARSVAREVGIDTVQAGLLPEEKLAAVEALVNTHEMVAMVGDGVNDAPAMARAHIGIAMGAIGSDAAVETADIALMTDDIGKLPWLIRHSRRTMGIIHQNIALSLVTKAGFVALAAFGMASMWGAIAADVGVALVVVLNALRLLRADAGGGGVPGARQRRILPRAVARPGGV